MNWNFENEIEIKPYGIKRRNRINQRKKFKNACLMVGSAGLITWAIYIAIEIIAYNLTR